MMRKLQILLIILILLKFSSIGIYPLHDTTEARYAGIAFRMVEKNDFITPWFLPDIPFLGKAPFSFWATAISFKVFESYHEFFARLPHFLMSLIVMFVGFLWTKKIAGIERGYKFSIIFASTVGFSLLSSVMTEASLIMGITFTNIGFFYGIKKDKRYGYLFFIGLTISILTKGLVGVVLSGMPCFFYVLIRNKWRELLNLPLITGFTLTFSLTFPWFYLMEKANPGFLEYFIVGEHFNRFLVSGWQGDRFGTAHNEPLFMIIPFFMLCSLQWLIYASIIFVAKLKAISFKNLSDENLFLGLSFILPLLFFSFSKNIVIPYAIPSILPFVMLIAINRDISFKALVWLSLPLVILGVFLFASLDSFKHSDKFIIQHFNIQEKKVLYYLEKPDFSSYFYARDKIKQIEQDEMLLLNDVFFVSKNKNRYEQKVYCDVEKCLYKK
jgi:4-amino-4-deoxy-L-arabinose transferase-like glycosyltransferase